MRLKVDIDPETRAATYISIPTGAIKRGSSHVYQSLAAKFQFLLVRLKGHRSARALVLHSISIPTGAIKRNRNAARRAIAE